MKEKIDLHVHTKYSDGKYSIEEILKISKSEGINKIAITDHDTIINLKNYQELEYIYDIEIIPGVEISANKRGLHILGYNIKDMDKMEEKLLQYRKYNHNNCKECIEYLEEIGIFLDIDKKLINREDIINGLITNGYVEDREEALEEYVGNNGIYYLGIKKMEAFDAIKLIKDCGGIPVLAHPFTLGLDKEDLIEFIYELTSYGLEGIETINGNINDKNNKDHLEYEAIADELGLLKTCGSDFHDKKQKLGILQDSQIWNDLKEEKQKVLSLK